MKLASTVFGVRVIINMSGETGIVSGFCQHRRNKAKQFFVEYRTNDGSAAEGWFFEDQLTEIV